MGIILFCFRLQDMKPHPNLSQVVYLAHFCGVVTFPVVQVVGEL